MNDSAAPNGLSAAEVRTTTGDLLVSVSARDKWIKKGEKLKVGFKIKELNTLLGFQFTLEFNHLRIHHIQNGIVKSQHMAKVANDALTICWDQLSAGTIDQVN